MTILWKQQPRRRPWHQRLQTVLGILYFSILVALVVQFGAFRLFLRSTEEDLLIRVVVNNSNNSNNSTSTIDSTGYDLSFKPLITPVFQMSIATPGTATSEYNETTTTNRIKIRNATTTIPNRRQSSSMSSKSQSHLPTNISSSPTTNNNSKWAYAFLVSGCTNETTTTSSIIPGYRGFLYNIVVTTQRLRDLGSTQTDFVVFLQMSSSTPATTLSPDEEALLRRMDIQMHYLPKMRSWVHETFYAVVQEKFRILQLTQYDRVLFLDGDLLPVCNLDYLFALSDDSNISNLKLQENVLLATQTEAANAGLFLLKPNADDWTLLQNVVIRRKEEQALTLPWPHFDERQGWNTVDVDMSINLRGK
jgi:hypothetical protein